MRDLEMHREVRPAAITPRARQIVRRGVPLLLAAAAFIAPPALSAACFQPDSIPPATPTAPPAATPAERPAGTPPTPEPAPREALPEPPLIRIDREAHLVELTGVVPIDVNAKADAVVYLEVIACTPDTKEHEALVMTRAKASDVHAALLALGIEPGTPGEWSWDDGKLASKPPTGPGLSVTIAYTGADGREIEVPASDWVTVESSKQSLTQSAGSSGGFVFAGSKFVPTKQGERYKADADGTLIGLTTFGGETIAWKQVLSPQSEVQQPDWIADRARVPAYLTPVKIRIRPAQTP